VKHVGEQQVAHGWKALDDCLQAVHPSLEQYAVHMQVRFARQARM